MNGIIKAYMYDGSILSIIKKVRTIGQVKSCKLVKSSARGWAQDNSSKDEGM